jgi:hypothetical protein
MHRLPKRVLISQAYPGLGAAPGPGKRRQQDRDEEGNDADNYQKLQKSESMAPLHSAPPNHLTNMARLEQRSKADDAKRSTHATKASPQVIGNLIFADERAKIRGWRVWEAGERWGSFFGLFIMASGSVN